MDVSSSLAGTFETNVTYVFMRFPILTFYFLFSKCSLPWILFVLLVGPSPHFLRALGQEEDFSLLLQRKVVAIRRGRHIFDFLLGRVHGGCLCLFGLGSFVCCLVFALLLWAHVPLDRIPASHDASFPSQEGKEGVNEESYMTCIKITSIMKLFGLLFDFLRA